MDKHQILDSIYKDVRLPGSFSSAKELYKTVQALGYNNIKPSDVRHYLSTQSTYTLLKRKVNKTKKHIKITQPYKTYQLFVDSAFMPSTPEYLRANDNFAFFLLATNFLTGYIYTRPLKSLKTREVAPKLREILLQSHAERVFSDGGSEYKKDTARMMNQLGVKHIVNVTSLKSWPAEQKIKQVKLKLYKRMNASGNFKWKNYLSTVTTALNNTSSRVLHGLTPIQAESMESPALWLLRNTPVKKAVIPQPKSCLPKRKPHRNPYKYKVGTLVRSTVSKSPFRKVFHEALTREVFIIHARKLHTGVPLYQLRSRDEGDLISGWYYEHEIEPVNL
mgnify:CR=1 FL=1